MSQGSGLETEDVAAPDLSRDLFEGRAAIREQAVLARAKAKVDGVVASVDPQKKAVAFDAAQGGVALKPGAANLARDLFEERAAIREHDGGLSREQAEALAVEDVARALSLPVAEMRAALKPGAVVLDTVDLPYLPCTRCGGGDYWKPMSLPFEGNGWRCATCQPPGEDDWRHAVSVP